MIKRDLIQKSKRIFAAVLILSVGILPFDLGGNRQSSPVFAQEPAMAFQESSGESMDSYDSYLEKHAYDGTIQSGRIDVDVTQYEADEGMEVTPSDKGIETSDVGRITWTFRVEEAGFYNIKLSYFTIEGTRSNPSRRLELDGAIPYPEMGQLLFRRLWADEEIKYVEDGVNEIRPSTNELPYETSVFLRDQETRYEDALLVYLSSGEHTVALSSVKEPLGIAALSFEQESAVPSYEAYQAAHADAPVYDGDLLIGQAERADGITVAVTKNSPSIIVNMNYSDPSLMPSHPYHMIYNTIGAESWQQPGDAVTWEIDVPQAGWYYLSFKSRQHINRGVTAYRKLYINDEVPFEEAKQLSFDFSGEMTWNTVGDQAEAQRIYLDEGVNKITLEAVLGEMGLVVTEIQTSLLRLNEAYLKTVQLTGQVPDQYIDYEVARKIPSFPATMREEAERLYAMVDHLVALTGEKGESTAIVEKMAVQAALLAEDPEEVTAQISQLKNNISALATYLVNVLQSPLEVDGLFLVSDLDDLPEARANWLDRTVNNIKRFFATFFVDRTSLSSDVEGESDDPLTVWMVTGSSSISGSISSGREQAQIVRSMINDTYTPLSGQAVNLELIPTDVVLRSALAGIGPDAIVGLGQDTLADFAMRGALKSLNDYPTFQEHASIFPESVITASSYQGEHYGLPEQLTYMTLFYREDILNELGLDIPQTWDDVRAMIPILQMNQYDFFLPNIGSSVYNSLVLQYGGNIYDGTDLDYGIKSGLYSDEAMQAFSDYTNFFTSYKLEVQVDFANRFRTGEMPIGIAEYSLYNQLEVFAPEIRGKWSFALLPGVEDEQGTINRSYIPNSVQSAILANTDQPTASWSFLEWWTSVESQVRYANTLESVMGSAARYFPASESALRQLPWSNAELNVLTEQMNATVGIPAIPGHYMNGRMVGYAYYAVLDDAQNPREALYLNLKPIDEELSKKRAEFGLDYIDYNGPEEELVRNHE